MKPALAAVAAVLSLSSAARAADGATTLRVTIETKNAGGVAAVALYDGPGRFAKADGAFRQAKAPVSGGRATVTFEGLPPGTYALGVFHDVNGDGRLNTLPVGLPTEPYGFSRGARGAFGPPKFAAAAFVVKGGVVTETVRLK